MNARVRSAATRITRWAIRGLDAIVRRFEGIHEFSDHPHCILRLSRGHSRRDWVLSDGTVVHAGDPVGDLHFWNERVPPMSAGGPDLTWGLVFYHRLRLSLQVLARCVAGSPEFDGLIAFRGEAAFMRTEGWEQHIALVERLGFDFVYEPVLEGRRQRFGRFVRNAYVWALMWTYNPASLDRKALLRMDRGELWISCTQLIDRHGVSRTGPLRHALQQPPPTPPYVHP